MNLFSPPFSFNDNTIRNGVLFLFLIAAMCHMNDCLKHEPHKITKKKTKGWITCTTVVILNNSTLVFRIYCINFGNDEQKKKKKIPLHEICIWYSWGNRRNCHKLKLYIVLCCSIFTHLLFISLVGKQKVYQVYLIIIIDTPNNRYNQIHRIKLR